MVSSESAVRWRNASSHQWRSCASLGRLVALEAFCRSSSSMRLAFAVLVLLFLEALVGLDDALHQRVAHHVLGLEVGEADAGDVLQHLDHVGQAGLGAAWQVDLGDV